MKTKLLHLRTFWLFSVSFFWSLWPLLLNHSSFLESSSLKQATENLFKLGALLICSFKLLIPAPITFCALIYTWSSHNLLGLRAQLICFIKLLIPAPITFCGVIFTLLRHGLFSLRDQVICWIKLLIPTSIIFVQSSSHCQATVSPGEELSWDVVLRC